ncbi:MAG: oligosaccharide flippase family protein [Oscillospiraceae bacterium]|nr:oligosaccharide flippase family protein [Oscillospiraceae bacterium]
MTREEKLAKNTMILAIGTFLPKLAAFITLPILTGCLTKEDWGFYELIVDLVSLILPTATLQIQTAAFRFLIDRKDKQEDVRSIITNIYAFIVPISVAALLILYLCLYFLVPGQPSSIKLLICLYFFADILVNAARQVSRGMSKNLFYSLSAIVSALCKIIFAVVFVWWLKVGLEGAVWALFLASLISLIVLSLLIRLHRYIDLHSISVKQIKELIAYSWGMVPNCMSMWVMRVSDRFVVTGFMGYAANAIYSAANKIPSILTIAQTTFTMAWQENASIVSKDKDAGAYYSSMFRTMFDLMAGFLGLLISATPLLFKLLIRGDYGDAYPHMPILFLAMFCYSMCAFLGGIYVAYMDTKSVGITTLAAAICNLLIDLLTIKFIGIYAASGSTLISYLLLFIFRAVDVRKLVAIKYDIRRILVIACILIAESALCFLHTLPTDCINLVFGVIVFCVLNRALIRAVWTKGTGLLKKKLHRS